MGRKKNMTLRHVLKLGEPKSRLYRFDQWNDIFRYWSIPVYRFKFIKKTNNTNKLMQVSYYFALTKIQKLQNFKKKKDFFCAGRQCLKLAGMAGT